MSLRIINPFYATRFQQAKPAPHAESYREVYARLPRAPKNASPVPHLTSLYHFDRAGDYGSASVWRLGRMTSAIDRAGGFTPRSGLGRNRAAPCLRQRANRRRR